MSFADSFDQLLTKLDRDAEVKDWQLFAHQNTSLKAGFLQDQLGMIYRPIQEHHNSGIQYLVVLQDGRVAQGNASPERLKDINQLAVFIKNSATKLATEAQLAPVQSAFKPTKLADQEVIDIIESQPEKITELAKNFMQTQLSYGLDNIEGEVELKHARQRFAGSQGLDMKSSETLNEFGVEYNTEIGASERANGLVDQTELSKLQTIAEYANALRGAKAEIKSGTYPVVFEPYGGFGLLDCYIFNNIRGVSVEAGVTRFDAQDFKKRKKIAKDDFNLSVDQTIAMKPESFNFTSEGVVAQKFDVIKNGCLTDPICNLQSAKQLGVPPRALGSLSRAQIAAQSLEDYTKKNPKFILLLTPMGIHTLNEVIGTYSLPVPSALYFENGSIVGAVNCVITGDFFAKLMDPQTNFVQLEAYQKPSLTFETDVTIK
ncbi:hypothetical protein HYX70_01960 [Candidatus Saccharibacteria bacterium]|nr:hypothetical protein [Candidatus Saccharibacteria bacterium]